MGRIFKELLIDALPTLIAIALIVVFIYAISAIVGTAEVKHWIDKPAKDIKIIDIIILMILFSWFTNRTITVKNK